ncbi:MULTISPECIES: anti-sigma factor [unclassified Paenibacillus]|uniref:anti-sigma factor domain-containing protein n=1 Tax=unclassified Paenibacillus TaxID=185978 RepID=UPI00104A690F|nr:MULTISPECIES: anti-sigma factor [unclassified Paenibacillus]NIK68270.1 anti-sigma-K factor RskA [Paenibacillus sp. BK720]TCM99515.1 anti-sigma-K factor rskA [Paenibacillus sp. BK033]
MSVMPEEQCKIGFSEEQWIDWLLGKQPGVRYAEMANHLQQCSACREKVTEWQSIFAPAAGYGEFDRTADDRLPSDRIRNRLRSHVRRRGIVKRLRSGWTSRSKWTAALVSAVVAVVCAASLYGSVRQPDDQRNDYVAAHEPEAVDFIHAPETASYKVHPYNNELGEGYIWFNSDSGEMLVLLDGMLSSRDYDIQAWALEGGSRVNLGLLEQSEKKHAHLYVKAGALVKASQLALTIEPSGGSVEPTSPDAFLFKMEH